MSCIFGPVPSRRLGHSLGIDPIPLKTCNWNCIYCQLGRTTPLTNERKSYIPAPAILQQLSESLERIPAADIDWITFVGSGEPTLHSQLGEMIREVKQLSPHPVAVLTNGALLYQPRIRRELMEADAVLPSLDAGSKALYRKINRPWPKLTFERHVAGLKAFRQEYSGKFWIEVMLVGGLNDSDEALTDLAEILQTLEPDEIHINVPTRPPAEPWVEPPPPERLERAHALLGSVSRLIQAYPGTASPLSQHSLAECILDIITRHPMQLSELAELMPDHSSEEVLEALFTLRADGLARSVDRLGKSFWSHAQGRYPDI